MKFLTPVKEVVYRNSDLPPPHPLAVSAHNAAKAMASAFLYILLRKASSFFMKGSVYNIRELEITAYT